MWMNGVQVFRLGLLGVVQIPAQLQVHPEVRRHAEVLCQTQGDAGRNVLLVGDDFVNLTQLASGKEACADTRLWKAFLVLFSYSRTLAFALAQVNIYFASVV